MSLLLFFTIGCRKYTSHFNTFFEVACVLVCINTGLLVSNQITLNGKCLSGGNLNTRSWWYG